VGGWAHCGGWATTEVGRRAIGQMVVVGGFGGGACTSELVGVDQARVAAHV
jgi:hypothetical protein